MMATRGSIFNGFFELPSQILERIIGARKKHDYQFKKCDVNKKIREQA